MINNMQGQLCHTRSNTIKDNDPPVVIDLPESTDFVLVKIQRMSKTPLFIPLKTKKSLIGGCLQQQITLKRKHFRDIDNEPFIMYVYSIRCCG